MAVIIAVGFVLWFALGVGCGYGYKSAYQHRGTSGGPDDDRGSIFPVSWIPPFMRNDWVVEEVVQGKEVYRGECPPDLSGCFQYRDKRMNKTVEVLFSKGTVVATVL